MQWLADVCYYKLRNKVFFISLSHTEKFYRALETNVVPVVYNAAGIHKVAPPHSYIDVRDFKSPKYLAQYLIYLDKNDYEYLSYFSWRKHFKCKEVNRSVKKVFCDLCQYLFEDNRPKVVQNFTKWFFKDAGCKSFPKQFWEKCSSLLKVTGQLRTSVATLWWNGYTLRQEFIKQMPR